MDRTNFSADFSGGLSRYQATHYSNMGSKSGISKSGINIKVSHQTMDDFTPQKHEFSSTPNESTTYLTFVSSTKNVQIYQIAGDDVIKAIDENDNALAINLLNKPYLSEESLLKIADHIIPKSLNANTKLKVNYDIAMLICDKLMENKKFDIALLISSMYDFRIDDILLENSLGKDSLVAAFSYACFFGNTDIVVELMADKRVNPAASNNVGLYFAVNNGHKEIAHILLHDARVDPTYYNEQLKQKSI